MLSALGVAKHDASLERLLKSNLGEIPETPRGEGFLTADGFRTRAPFQYDTNLHVDYGFRIGGNRRIVLLADVFNLLNTQRIYDYNNWTESSFGATNPDFGQPYSAILGLPAFQAPRQLRLGARVQRTPARRDPCEHAPS